MSTNQIESTQDSSATSGRWKAFITPTCILLAGVLLFLSVSFGWDRWESGRAQQTTDDAYIRGDVTPVSTKVSGIVSEVLVTDYQKVHEGDVLLRIEDTDYVSQVAQAKAAVLAAEAALTINLKQRDLQRARSDKARIGIDQAKSQMDAAQAGRDAVAPDLTRAKSELQRQQLLLAAQASTAQRFETIAAEEGRYEAIAKSRDADLLTAKVAIDSSQSALVAERRSEDVVGSQRLALDADLQRARAALMLAESNLEHTIIRAPADGMVGERQARKGQYVGPGSQVIPFVEDRVWIVANFRETQLAKIRVGDSATLSIDQFPSKELTGKVIAVAPASGSQFALLPPDNATGNFTKVAQRVPVRIALDDSSLVSQLRPGLSVQVKIHTTR